MMNIIKTRNIYRTSFIPLGREFSSPYGSNDRPSLLFPIWLSPLYYLSKFIFLVQV